MIQWYPGHMAKSKKEIVSNIKLVDVVYEIVDARIPKSSRNPDIDDIVKNKKRIILLNKADLADDIITDLWIEYFKEREIEAVKVNSITGFGLKEINEVTNKVCQDILKKKKQKGMIPRLRGIIVGVPNVGKSTFINKLIGNKRAKTGDKPGVTKALHWIKTPYFDLLDTPGILWPKFDDKKVGIMLAITGAIKDEVLDIEEIALNLVAILKKYYPNYLMSRYKIDKIVDKDFELLKEIGKKRGCLLAGGEVDTLKTSHILLEDFRKGKLGRISLERP
ncbi:Ras superfamily GTP-binding protein YlqF [Thermoanaerobacter uzonensis DSM 18761]|uniref:Ribosome biogenesis GTPase A n=1 Tax=Thermoanaerobacter uzonensis DSM 18761 TaxID=1123369 RepID=A0A1M4UPT8_9THEO|nr:ribosome biogenesis GTPase YlqF [Thermoanaerobacter uzonensis]SHE58724.1 Ras superfamily GTP-binding protein YlqF [Thermoanaerobacter uzonensis DSM 18761]